MIIVFSFAVVISKATNKGLCLLFNKSLELLKDLKYFLKGLAFQEIDLGHSSRVVYKDNKIDGFRDQPY